MLFKFSSMSSTLKRNQAFQEALEGSAYAGQSKDFASNLIL